MKKVYRRFSALLMCMILIFSLSSAASAGYVSWSDSEGGKTLTLTISEWSFQRVAVTNPRKTYHTQGTVTNLSPYGSFSATITADYSPTFYRSELVQAINLEGLLTTFTVYGEHTAPLAVPAEETSCYYTLGVLFDTESGSWGVSKGMLARSPATFASLVESGTLYFAPRGTVHGYVAMPVP